MASLEVVEEEEFHDVEEGQVEAIDDDDDDDMAVINKVSSMQADKSDARGDPDPMDVDEQGNKMVQSTSSVKTWRTDTSAATAGASSSDPSTKLQAEGQGHAQKIEGCR